VKERQACSDEDEIQYRVYSLVHIDYTTCALLTTVHMDGWLLYQVHRF
jgi:hypothetical protein